MNELSINYRQKSGRVLVAGAALILLATLFPFRFYLDAATWAGVGAALTQSLANAYALDEVGRNLLLFMPFGFGLAGWLASARRRAWLAAWLAGAVLSLSVELLQQLLRVRNPSLVDVIANSSGALLGALLYTAWGKQLLARSVQWNLRLHRLAKRPRLLIFLSGVSGFALCLFGVSLLIAFASKFFTPPSQLIAGVSVINRRKRNDAHTIAQENESGRTEAGQMGEDAPPSP